MSVTRTIDGNDVLVTNENGTMRIVGGAKNEVSATGGNVNQTTNPPFLYRYPYKKIESSDDYLMVEILEYIPPGLTTQPGSFALNTSDQTYEQTTKIIGSIILPIPDTIGDNNAADWGEGSMGPIEAAAASVALKTIENPSKFLESGKGELKKIADALGTATGQSAIQKGLASAAIKAVLGDRAGQKYLERGAGITFNQNVELLFSGLKLRQSFGFGYDMVPRSQKEAIEIKNIIKAFKKYSAVRKGNDIGGAAGLFLKAPHVFRIRYMSGSNPHPFLNKFKICALPAMAVNYTGSGTYATYSDATPVHIILSLQFQELTPIFFEDYQDTDTTVGY
jgi:hypothetical protein